MNTKNISIAIVLALVFCMSIFAIKDQIKGFLRENLPFHTKAYVNNLLKNQEINFISNEIAYRSMQDFFNVPDFPELKKFENSYYFSSDRLELETFKTNFLLKQKNEKATGGAYLAQFKENIIIAQENGLFFNLSSNELDSKSSKIGVDHIDSNIFSIIKYFEFYGPGQYGIKGMYADSSHLYVSVSFKQNKDCFNTSILRAPFKENFLEFSVFFVPNQCVNIFNEYGEYNASDSGGRIANFDESRILFSSGSFRFRDLAQDSESHLGKILAIHKDSANAEIISMGHRNVMGLVYSKNTNQIWSTEHGPNGGDEINSNVLDIGPHPKNFGWPISSYGEHYAASNYNPEGALIVDTDHATYAKAPLHKSHKEYGFVEPVLYFTPSIGISAIEIIDERFSKEKRFDMVFASMGTHKNAALEKSIFLFDSKEKKYQKIFQGERIRDILFLQKKSILMFTGETTGIIGIISLK